MASIADKQHIAEMIANLEKGMQNGDSDYETFATAITAIIAEYQLTLWDLEEIDTIVQDILG